MSKKKHPNRRQSGNPATRAAEAASRREEHVRTRLAREGDPSYIHTALDTDGIQHVYYSPHSADGRALHEVLSRRQEEFREQFGREMGPEDPLFWDPTSTEPRPMTDAQTTAMLNDAVEAAEAAGIDPAYTHAWRVTGRIVTEENRHNLTAHEVEEWYDAVHEYRTENPRLYNEHGEYRGEGTVPMWDPAAWDAVVAKRPRLDLEIFNAMSDRLEVLSGLLLDAVHSTIETGDPRDEFARYLQDMYPLFPEPSDAQHALVATTATLIRGIQENKSHVDVTKVLAWSEANLAPDIRPVVREVSVLIETPALSLNQGIFGHLGTEIIIPGLFGLSAAVTATHFEHNPEWILYADE